MLSPGFTAPASSAKTGQSVDVLRTVPVGGPAGSRR